MDDSSEPEPSQDEVQRLRHHRAVLEERLAELFSENESLRAENEELNQRVGEDLLGQVQDLEQQRDELEQRVQELESRLGEELLTDVERLEGENQELDGRVQELEGMLGEDLLAEVGRLEDENQALDDRVGELQDLVGVSAVDEIERLEMENTELRDQVEMLMQSGQEVDGLLSNRGSDEEPVYIASPRRGKFHRPNWKWAQYIRPDDMVEFGSHREAVEARFKPCGTCRA